MCVGTADPACKWLQFTRYCRNLCNETMKALHESVRGIVASWERKRETYMYTRHGVPVFARVHTRLPRCLFTGTPREIDRDARKGLDARDLT